MDLVDRRFSVAKLVWNIKKNRISSTLRPTKGASITENNQGDSLSTYTKINHSNRSSRLERDEGGETYSKRKCREIRYTERLTAINKILIVLKYFKNKNELILSTPLINIVLH